MDHDDDTEAESCAAQTQRTVAAIAHTVASPNAVKSQQIYEKILAEVMTDAPSSDDLVAPPTFEEHNSFRLSIAASASSLYSVPIEEEEWRRRKQHHLKHYNAASLTSLSEIASEEEQQQQQDHGGRLWRLAGEIAAQKASLRGNNRTGPVGHLAETFMERMRSRADPNAMISPPTPPRPDPRSTKTMMVKMTSSSSDDYPEDKAFLINPGIAHKRVRVVQLLIIGLVGILLAWLGNFFVSRSCYFATVPVAVGQNGDVFPLRFGLWNYSPADSALNGYKYCYPYGGSHRTDAPILSRIFNLAALLAGTYSLIVLWWYLISGRVVPIFWKAAVYAAVGAGALQLFTPIVFFWGSMCRQSSCSAGPAAALSAVTAVAWVILGAELHYHCPVVGVDAMHDDGLADESLISGSTGSKGSTTPVTQLEMADLAEASQEYLERFHKKRTSRRRYRPPEFS